jgi:DNA-binding HxlR family transcriptional regulator
VILHRLLGQTLRFNQLMRTLPRITQRMLTTQLRELKAESLITRKVYAQVPPRVAYSISPRGKSLKPVLEALLAWGEKIP